MTFPKRTEIVRALQDANDAQTKLNNAIEAWIAGCDTADLDAQRRLRQDMAQCASAYELAVLRHRQAVSDRVRLILARLREYELRELQVVYRYTSRPPRQ